MTELTEDREISTDSFRERMRKCFGNGEKMSQRIAGLSLRDWPERLSRPTPKTCRSWLNGHTDPGLTQIVYLIRQMRRIEKLRAASAKPFRWFG